MLVVDPRFTIGPLIGAGGMGRVYAAEDAGHHPVAIKLLRPGLAANAHMTARLAAEATCARRVLHPNVIRVLEYGATCGTPFLVMELASGRSVAQLIRTHGPLALTEIRSIAYQLLAGLAAIHRAGLIHGDLKSENLLLDDSGHVTIIDLGLAREPGTDAVPDGPPTLSGTPAYLAPEVIRGAPYTHVADLYSAGVVIYELLTGTTPFGGGRATEVLVRQLHRRVPRPALRTSRRIPARLEHVLLRTLDKRPAHRYQSAAELAFAITGALPHDLDEDRDHDQSGGAAAEVDVALTLDELHPRGAPTLLGRRRSASGMTVTP